MILKSWNVDLVIKNVQFFPSNLAKFRCCKGTKVNYKYFTNTKMSNFLAQLTNT